MLSLRPTTNLKIPDNLILSNNDNKRGFLYVYNVHFKMLSPVFIARLFFGGIAPEVVYHPSFGNKRSLRKALRDAERPTSLGIKAGLLSIKKVLDDGDPYFLVTFPALVITDVTGLRDYFRLFFDARDFAKDRTLDEKINNIATSSEALASLKIDLPTVIANLQATGAMKVALEDSFIQAGIGSLGSAVASITMRLESYEAEQLVTTPFEQIRPNDLYAILLNWANNYYGAFRRPPKAAFPIGKIAATLPTSTLIKPRVNESNITLDDVGKPLLIPSDVDNIDIYDQAYLIAGQRSDGSFQLANYGDTPEETKARRLPANQPVFVDWLNSKFTYSNTAGHLDTFDLAQCRAPGPTQLVRIAKRPMNERILTNIFNIGKILNVPPFQVRIEDVKDMGDFGESIASKTWKPADYVKAMIPFFQEEVGFDQIRWCDLAGNTFRPFKAIMRHLLDIGKAAYENMDVVYDKYSVMHTLRIIPYILIVCIYSSKERFAALEAEDLSEREVYIKQGADPDWPDESLPLKWKNLGQLPHQKRARNQLRNFPKSAILPIEAGGGKTPVIILDILKFIKANKGFPFMIMCPSHLVAQYVTEIALFTDGKLNAIPVNTATLTSNSLDRVGKIIQSMPRNTVVIVDYDVTSRILTDNVIYGTTPVNVYHVIEFLRQFGFQYAALDEAHYLRNDSGRTEAVRSMLVDIPYIRLASGTMAHDSMTDLAMQFSIIDPTVFGSKDDFNNEYGADVSGGRVLLWKPDAEQRVNAAIRANTVVCRAHRKEWAALLPPFQEHLHIVQLNPEQQAAYNDLMEEVTEDLVEEAKTNPLLKKWLDNQELGQDPDSEDEIQAENLEQLLKKHLARLERFVTAMGRDDWGKLHLDEENWESPKIQKIIEICEQHVANNDPGKILIFTNYVWSAEEIYNRMPASLRNRFVLYKAADKVEAMAKFDHPNTIGMVGVSSSMDTGLNLQAASRLIREAMVWNPGTLEQGDARIGRPQLKKKETRNVINYDIVLANNTIDMSKLGRLYSKLLSVEKFNNAGDPRYDSLPNLEVISLNFDNLFDYSNIEAVMPYIEGYKAFKQVRDDDYKEYRARYGNKPLELEPIKTAPDPKDAVLMREVPYVPGGGLPHMEELGLVRLDVFLNSAIVLPDIEEDGAEEEELDRSDEWVARANELTAKMPVNCQFGEGRIQRILARGVSVRLPTGELVNLHRSTVFVKERPIKNIRQALSVVSKIKVQEDQDIPVPYFFKKGKVRSVENALKDIKTGPKEKVQLVAEVYINVVNGYLGLEYYPIIDDDSKKKDPLVPAVQSLGFRYTPDYMYAEVSNGRRLRAQLVAWRDKGFQIDDTLGMIEQFKMMHHLLVSKKLQNDIAMYKYSQAATLRNFLRLEHKPSNKRNIIKPYPLLDNGVAYIALPIKGQSATKRAITVRAPGIIWHKSEPVLQCFTLTVPKTLELIKRIQKNGIQIMNLPELKKELTKLKRQPIRTDSISDI